MTTNNYAEVPSGCCGSCGLPEMHNREHMCDENGVKRRKRAERKAMYLAKASSLGPSDKDIKEASDKFDRENEKKS